MDRWSGSSASLTAAGLINPIIGKRLTQSACFDVFFAAARSLSTVVWRRKPENLF